MNIGYQRAANLITAGLVAVALSGCSGGGPTYWVSSAHQAESTEGRESTVFLKLPADSEVTEGSPTVPNAVVVMRITYEDEASVFTCVNPARAFVDGEQVYLAVDHTETNGYLSSFPIEVDVSGDELTMEVLVGGNHVQRTFAASSAKEYERAAVEKFDGDGKTYDGYSYSEGSSC